MRVTVCEMHDERDLFERDWKALADHVREEESEVVVLPEMPFAAWFAAEPTFNQSVWDAVTAAHAAGITRLCELAPAVVLGTRALNDGQRRLNRTFAWDASGGYRPGRDKHYLPDLPGTWEASWYHRGEKRFAVQEHLRLRIGWLVCSELWALEQARLYGCAGANLLVTPRATGRTTVDKWLAGGRAAAIVAGAFSLSSNRTSEPDWPNDFGGGGWIVEPDGEVLGLTSRDRPFVTVDLDLTDAERASTTYPRSLFSCEATGEA